MYSWGKTSLIRLVGSSGGFNQGKNGADPLRKGLLMLLGDRKTGRGPNSELRKKKPTGWGPSELNRVQLVRL